MKMHKLLQLLRDNGSTERTAPQLLRNDAGDAVLYVYDVIDAYWGISASDVVKAIAGLGAETTLHLRINSPGGDVFEATAMANAIRQHAGKTIAYVDGVCASAATDLACAADEVHIAEGGFYMVHNAWTIAMGDKQAFADTASLLGKVDGQIADRYAKRTGATLEQVVQWMDAETWFTAQEAVDAKFADSLVQPPAKGAAGTANVTRKTFNLSAYSKAPAALLAPPAAEPATPDWAAVRANNARRLQLLQID